MGSAIDVDLHADVTHGADRACDLGCLAFHAERGEIGADLRGGGLTRHNDIHRVFGFEIGQVGAVDGFGDEGLEHGKIRVACCVLRGGHFDFEKILEQVFAVFGENGLGVELHAVGGMLFVFESHHFAFVGLGDDFEFGGNRFVDDQRVVAHGFKGRGMSLKMPCPL